MDRKGFALAVAMLAIVVIGARIAGAFFASTQEFRVGRNTLVEQRAFSVAEFGLNSEISNWDRSRNLPAPRGRLVGQVDSQRVYVRQGDTAFVKVTRLNDNTFWVVSSGGANIGSASTQSLRQTNAFVRIAYPTIQVGGAVQVAGDLTLSGAAKIDGRNTAPSGWDCSGITGGDTAAVAVGPTATLNGIDSTGLNANI